MIKAAVVGATGYTGEELVRVLAGHREVKLVYVSGKEDRADKIQELFPHLKGRLDLVCRTLDLEESAREADVVFLSLPHTVSMTVAPFYLERGKKVIDLSADYRNPDAKVYESFYGTAHADAKYLKEAVYGLPELFRNTIRKARLIANPGCFPTGALLALLPFLKDPSLGWKGTAILDSKSGVTGAGRKAAKNMLFGEVNENFKAYRVLTHQHEPEIDLIMRRFRSQGNDFAFVPHLLPLNRGILTTVYLKLGDKPRVSDIYALYESAFRDEPFLHLRPKGQMPELKDSAFNNACHAGVSFRERDQMAVIVTVIDNLLKGAAGQAVQNMNLMYGFKETEGLS